MLATSTPPCVAPCAFTDSGYISYLGGTPPSWQQITSERYPCLVARMCDIDGLPTRLWFSTPVDVLPAPPDAPVIPTLPVRTAEPSTWVMLAGGIGILLARAGRRRRA